MPYIGKEPAKVPVTAADIPDNSITAAKILDGVITAADIGADAVGLSELSATGTASNTTFLRGDNTWQVVAGTTTRTHAFSKSVNKLIWTHTEGTLSLKDGNNNDNYLAVEIGSSDQVYSINSDGKLICTYT